MALVCERTDAIIPKTMSNPVRVHSFTATSDFEAFQKNYDWNGWGTWKPEPDWTERFFTDAEAEDQRRYIASRTRC